MPQDTLRLSPKAVRALIFNALSGAGTAEKNAGHFADVRAGSTRAPDAAQ